uniref:Putative secreted peptide n=1 Tax=Anopheles braziliensis TaxID=58242 RepID=A0A2M3ZTM2_9DIPT
MTMLMLLLLLLLLVPLFGRDVRHGDDNNTQRNTTAKRTSFRVGSSGVRGSRCFALLFFSFWGRLIGRRTTYLLLVSGFGVRCGVRLEHHA